MGKSQELPSALLVDDNPLVLKSLGMIFDALNWKTAQVHDSEQAMKQLDEQHFDLAVLDLRMPEDNGISLCKRIRKNPKHRDLVIFIHSGYVDNLAQMEAKSSGANAVLHKPVGMDEIRLHLKNFGLPNGAAAPSENH